MVGNGEKLFCCCCCHTYCWLKPSIPPSTRKMFNLGIVVAARVLVGSTHRDHSSNLSKYLLTVPFFSQEMERVRNFLRFQSKLCNGHLCSTHIHSQGGPQVPSVPPTSIYSPLLNALWGQFKERKTCTRVWVFWALNFHPPGPFGQMEDWWACAVHSWFLTIVDRGYRLVCNETTHFQLCGVFSVCSPKPLSWEQDLGSSSYLEYFMYALTAKRKQRKNTQVLLHSLSGLGFGISDVSHSEYRISRPQTFFSGLSVVRCSGTVEDVGFSGLGVLPET